MIDDEISTAYKAGYARCQTNAFTEKKRLRRWVGWTAFAFGCGSGVLVAGLLHGEGGKAAELLGLEIALFLPVMLLGGANAMDLRLKAPEGYEEWRNSDDNPLHRAAS